MSLIEEKLEEMGLTLPEPPSPGGNYVPHKKVGNLVYLAGVICIQNGVLSHEGQVGSDQTIESGYEAAKVCALNALAAIKGAVGDFDKLREIVYMSGYVNAVSGFDSSPLVINGASDLFIELLGEKGMHARAAVAVAGLPKNATVEIQLVVHVDD
ncbi:RidA family protein [Pelagicoccus albus]|uniref:RidA family protein n=1 Tax=Pelagicoccus albus TaxID=415222 RepID=A0A7X1B9L5_9BACT|nr:RidA family protein [Pelagicoccus albus]MBC2607869.1 RidA family protein [Pelagicoccus albus]